MLAFNSECPKSALKHYSEYECEKLNEEILDCQEEVRLQHGSEESKEEINIMLSECTEVFDIERLEFKGN